MEDTIEVQPLRFEIKVERGDVRRKPWVYSWREIDDRFRIWNYDPDGRTRFKTADEAYAAAIDEIYANLAKLKRREAFMFERQITVP